MELVWSFVRCLGLPPFFLGHFVPMKSSTTMAKIVRASSRLAFPGDVAPKELHRSKQRAAQRQASVSCTAVAEEPSSKEAARCI